MNNGQSLLEVVKPLLATISEENKPLNGSGGATVAKPGPDAKIGIGGAPTRATIIPSDPTERKKYPMATGLLYYFPDALAVVSNVSWQGNEQHNPGQPLHWARSKSADQDDTIIRHLAESGTKDTDGIRHTAKAAWRILAKLQLELEAEMRGE